MKEGIIDPWELNLQREPKVRDTYTCDFEASQAPVLLMGGSSLPLTPDHIINT